MVLMRFLIVGSIVKLYKSCLPIFHGATRTRAITFLFVSPSQRVKNAQPQLWPMRIVCSATGYFSNSFFQFLYTGAHGSGMSAISAGISMESNCDLIHGIQCLSYIRRDRSIVDSSVPGQPWTMMQLIFCGSYFFIIFSSETAPTTPAIG